MKLTDLIRPEHVRAAYAKYAGLSHGDLELLLNTHFEELMCLAEVVGRQTRSNKNCALTMAAISIVDLAIQEATAGKKQ